MADNTSQIVETSVTTWGELLRTAPQVSNMVIPDMKIVIKESKVSVESEQSQLLPLDQDITIYLTPGKVKSGKDVFDKLIDEAVDEVMVALAQDFEAIAQKATKDTKETQPAVKTEDDFPF